MKGTSTILATILVFSLTVAFAQQGDLNQLSALRSGGDDQPFDYVLGPGDVIEVKVFGVEALDQTVRISAEGVINLQLLEPIKAAGLTTSQLRQRVISLFQESELIYNAQVSVLVTEYHAHTVEVMGAVNAPGEFALKGPSTLVDLLAQAGGLDQDRAGPYVFVQRPMLSIEGQSGPEMTLSIKVKLEDLLSGGELSLNHPIESGDVINVPERVRNYFYVTGEVGRPGAFEIPENGRVRLTQALSWAGGAQKTAKSDQGVLVRYDKEGNRQDFALDIKRIFKGEREDLEVLPQDVIFIPGSTWKSIGYGMIGIVPRTLSDSVSRGVP